MQYKYERHLLQIAIACAGFVPVLAGGAGALLGSRFVDPSGSDLPLDSHVRYLSGLLLAIGLVFWASIPKIEQVGQRVRLLTLIVFVGGLARLFGLATQGDPGGAMLFGLGMELVVTPALCAWQWRVEHRVDRKDP